MYSTSNLKIVYFLNIHLWQKHLVKLKSDSHFDIFNMQLLSTLEIPPTLNKNIWYIYIYDIYEYISCPERKVSQYFQSKVCYRIVV